MLRFISPAPLAGCIAAMPSKSRAHRLLICAALSQQPVTVHCSARSADILATVSCLRALGANISDQVDHFQVTPLDRRNIPANALLDCGESGSTLRFLLPVVCALGQPVQFQMHGRLPERPLTPLYEELLAHGAHLNPVGTNPLRAAGPLIGTDFCLDASISSQFISGLLFALPLLGGGTLQLTGPIESAAYLDMTVESLELAGVHVQRTTDRFAVQGSYAMPSKCQVEGDWSNAAFWLCAGAIGPYPITMTGLNLQSSQGDRAILSLLRDFGASVIEDGDSVTVSPAELHGIRIDAAQIPDLIPILSIVAALADGETEIFNAGRLRIKESDRLSATAAMLTALGGQVQEFPEGLRIRGIPRFHSGTVDACNDHRIAMAAAIASTAAVGKVTVRDAESVNKSYPDFWRDFDAIKR